MSEYIIDLILIAIFALITFKYYKRGLVETIMRFGSFVVALVCAGLFSNKVTDWIYSNTKLFVGMERYLSKLIVFVLIYIAVRILFSWLIALLRTIKKMPVIKHANKLLGALFGVGCGLVAVIVISVGLQISSHVVYNAKYVNAIDSSRIVQTVLSNDKIAQNIQELKEYGGI